jgi:hypothetical protein
MTDELKLNNKTELTREQRTLRTALTVVWVMLALLDAFLFFNNDQPDNIVVALLLVPVAFAVLLAYRGDSTLAMWVFSGSLWAAGIYLVIDNPQTPQEIDDLVGRYLFPVIFVIPLAIITLKHKLQRNIMIIITLLVAGGIAFHGFTNDPDGAGTPNPQRFWWSMVQFLLPRCGWWSISSGTSQVT